MAGLRVNDMLAIILAVPSFAFRCSAVRNKKRINVVAGDGAGSFYEALSADNRRAVGLRPSLWVYDELAQAKDGRMLANLRTAMGKSKKTSLGLVISTQAEDDDHPLSVLIDEGLAGTDPTIYVQLLAADSDADPFAEETIRSVNPAMDIFLDGAVLLDEAAQAKRQPLYLPKFLNFRLNQRIDAEQESRLARASDWRAGDGAVDLERLAHKTCIGGLDLSAKHDMTAFVLVFPDEEAETGFDVVSYFWTPDGQLRHRPTSEEERLRGWIHDGHVESIPGPIIRYSFVARRIKELSETFEIAT